MRLLRESLAQTKRTLARKRQGPPLTGDERDALREPPARVSRCGYACAVTAFGVASQVS